MNIEYRPEKADFGMRYIYRDYPLSAYKLIEDALRASNIDEMIQSTEELLSTYTDLKEKLCLILLLQFLKN